MTLSFGSCERRLMIPSVMPSLRYSVFGSFEALASGRTAIESIGLRRAPPRDRAQQRFLVHRGAAADGAQREREVARRLKARRRILLDAGLDDALELRRRIRAEEVARESFHQDRGDRRRARFAMERLLGRDHLEQNATERKDVRARIDGLAAQLLGRHVAERADHRAGIGLEPARRRDVRLVALREQRDRSAPGRSRGSSRGRRR